MFSAEHACRVHTADLQAAVGLQSVHERDSAALSAQRTVQGKVGGVVV